MSTPQAVKDAATKADEELEARQKGGPKPSDTPPEPAAESLDQKLEKLEARFSTLQGKYNAEVAAVRPEIDELKRQNDELKGQLEESRKGAQRPATQRYLSDDEIENADGDTLDRTGRVARGVSEELVAPLQKSQQEIANEVDRIRKSTELTAFWYEVERLAPGARAANGDPESGIDADPHFEQWLDATSSPTPGMTMRQHGRMVLSSGNIPAIAAFFNLFLQADKPAPQPEVPARHVAVAPAVSGAPLPADDDKLTMADLQRMGKRAEELARQGRINEATEITDQMTDAVAQGRVTGQLAAE